MFNFIINQLLGMQWLSALVWNFLTKTFNASQNSPVWGSIHFFLYDTIKISILLSALVFSIAYLQSYFPPERTKKILSRYSGIGGNIAAALLGTVTPFCSCSSIPIFIGFTRAHLPIGTTFSFLISSPMVDLASLIMLTSFFGLKFAFIYTAAGLIIAVLGGLLLSKIKAEKYIINFNQPVRELYSESEYFNQKQRLDYALNDTKIIVRNVLPYVFIGVAVGAGIHNWVPQDLILSVLGKDNYLSVPLAALIGVPIYADTFGTIPIAEALYQVGVPAGTILALMMAITTLSLPSIIMLSKVLKPQLLGMFVSFVTLGIICVGYLFNTI